MKIETYIKKIQALHACEEAVEAAGKYTTSQEGKNGLLSYLRSE